MGRYRIPADPRHKAWLQVDGSLTAQLRKHGEVRVIVLREGTQLLWPQEQMDLQARCGYVREVILLVDGKAAVWARSATLRHAVQGPWRALANLGSRPLAELLFQGRSISRSPLRSHHTARHGPAAIHIRNSLGNHLRPAQSSFSPRWARSSVFGHQGQPLRVYEAFAPWLLNLACMPGR